MPIAPMAIPAEPGTASNPAASIEARMYCSVPSAWESSATVLPPPVLGSIVTFGIRNSRGFRRSVLDHVHHVIDALLDDGIRDIQPVALGRHRTRLPGKAVQ